MSASVEGIVNTGLSMIPTWIYRYARKNRPNFFGGLLWACCWFLL